MNVVTENKNTNVIDKLNIDIIKKIEGEFTLNDILNSLVNLYFNKMIIDSTSIKNIKDISTIKALAAAVDPSRVIMVLPEEVEEGDNEFISDLITCGFYNFTRNFEGVNYLFNTPNTYESVKQYVLNTPLENNSSDENADEETSEEALYQPNAGRRIIGVENVTTHAGSSSIVNMLVRQLRNHGYKAYGIEMFRQDLLFYHVDYLHACFNKQDLDNKLREFKDADVIVIDSNEFGELNNYANDTLYLVEPSYVKVTKAIKKNKNVFNDHKGDKIVLNMSFVNNQDLADFEYETGLKIFANIPPLNDRDKDLEEINDLLSKLGYSVK